LSPVANAMEKEPVYCRYSAAKIDSEVLYLARAAAALDHKSIQEWLSDTVNEAAARRTGQKPVKRNPPRPRK
jgi:hypothetical protein